MSVGSLLRALADLSNDPSILAEEYLDPKFHADRGQVIVAISRLEFALQKLIAQSLPISVEESVGLFKDNNLLASFQNKIQMGQALALYGKETTSCLHLFRNIRNTFAHSPSTLTLESDQIKAALDSMNDKVFGIREEIVGKPNGNIVFRKKCLTMFCNLTIKYFFGITTTSGMPMRDYMKTVVPDSEHVRSAIANLLALPTTLP